MKRLLALFLSAAALAAGVSACTSGPKDPAATVNGVEISQATVVDELEAIGNNTDYATQIEQSSGTKVHGSIKDSFDPAFVALVLSREIAFEIVGAEVAKRELEVTDAVRKTALDDLYNQMGQQDPAKGKAVFEKFPKDYQDELLQWNAEVLLLQDDTAAAYFEEHAGDFAQVCASHILVDTEEKANELKAQLDAGADFAAVAEANSSDTGSAAQGGDLGCQAPGTYVPEFEQAVQAAPVGQVVGPVQTQFGFHLIKVTSRKTPTFDEVKDQVRNAAFGAFFQEALTNAKVTVNDKYGTWNASTGQVDPPASSTSSATTSSTAAPAP